MRLSQIALHIVDNSSRIGSDHCSFSQTISEIQINDLFTSANLQAASLDLEHRGKVVLYSLEAMASPNETKFYVHWQRCYGQKVYAASQNQGAANLTYIGPTGKQVTSVPAGAAVMYVEVAYTYKPLISSRLVPTTNLTDTAAMIVRDDRDINGGVSGSGVYNSEAAPIAACS